jgi:NAD(P)-dependent dehydrogenase (short-subunit alcohol dehydrogenase family)
MLSNKFVVDSSQQARNTQHYDPYVRTNQLLKPPAIMDDLRFRGKTIVITGAGGQLGRAGCLYFSQRGCQVAALDISPTMLEETIQEASDIGSGQKKSIVAFACDVTDAAAVADVFSRIVETFGTIHYLWNNAGYQGQIAPILEQDPHDFDQVLRINVTGMFIVLQAAARCMVQQQQEELTSKKNDPTATATTTATPTTTATTYAMVNTASVAGLRGTPAMSGYASSKAAVIMLTVTAAKELASHNIRVNAISPALIGPGALWERQNHFHSQVGPPYFSSDPTVVAETKIQSVPLKRLGTAVEVVQSVAYLLSDDASYTTGINLVVDGGMAAGMKA